MTVELREKVAEAPPELAGKRALALVDALACLVLALLGAGIARVLDPWGWFFPQAIHVALALPFALLGPLGVGLYRGRVTPFVQRAAAIGAALGAALGASFVLGEPALALVFSLVLPLVLGPLVASWGTRFHRPEEDWRAAARLRPPEATPRLAFAIAHARLPFVLEAIVTPIALAMLPVALAGVVLIRCYQLALSRFLPPQCRFEPSCSRYGFEALWKLGAVKGFLLTALRVVRCQPFCKAGHDPVPGGSR